MYDFTAFRFFYSDQPISYRVDFSIDLDSLDCQKIKVCSFDFDISNCDSYLFFQDQLHRLNQLNIRCLLNANSIDMGVYEYIRTTVLFFSRMLGCFDDDYFLNLSCCGNEDYLRIIDRSQCQLLIALANVKNCEFSDLFKGSSHYNNVFSIPNSGILFGNTIMIDDSIRSVIRAWVKFVLWIDERYKKVNCPIVITAEDAEDWRSFSQQFDTNRLDGNVKHQVGY